MRILLISPIFFPEALPESYLMMKQLGGIGSIDVLTSECKYLRRSDNSMKPFVDHSFGNVYRIKFLDLLKRLPINRIKLLAQNPDSHRISNFFYLRVALKLIQENKYDVVITWSQPHSCHLIGLKLKKVLMNRISWVAHFSDPWIENPYHQRGTISKKYNFGIRNNILNLSDAILYTNKYFLSVERIDQNEYWMRKSYEVPHCFVKELYPAKSERSSKDVYIRHIGNFYGKRKADVIFEILHTSKNWIEEYLSANFFHLEFYGSSQEKIEFDESFLPCNFRVKIHESVDYLESLKLMREADLLLVIDGPFEKSPFLPSKIIDYLGSEKPIFAITPPLGATADLINSYGGWVSNYDTNEDSSRKFVQALFAICSNSKIIMDDSVRSKYSSRVTNELMANVLSNLRVTE